MMRPECHSAMRPRATHDEVFLIDAAKAVLAAYWSEDENELRAAIGYLTRCLDRKVKDQ